MARLGPLPPELGGPSTSAELAVVGVGGGEVVASVSPELELGSVLVPLEGAPVVWLVAAVVVGVCAVVVVVGVAIVVIDGLLVGLVVVVGVVCATIAPVGPSASASAAAPLDWPPLSPPIISRINWSIGIVMGVSPLITLGVLLLAWSGINMKLNSSRIIIAASLLPPVGATIAIVVVLPSDCRPTVLIEAVVAVVVCVAAGEPVDLVAPLELVLGSRSRSIVARLLLDAGRLVEPTEPTEPIELIELIELPLLPVAFCAGETPCCCLLIIIITVEAGAAVVVAGDSSSASSSPSSSSPSPSSESGVSLVPVSPLGVLAGAALPAAIVLIVVVVVIITIGVAGVVVLVGAIGLAVLVVLVIIVIVIIAGAPVVGNMLVCAPSPA